MPDSDAVSAASSDASKQAMQGVEASNTELRRAAKEGVRATRELQALKRELVFRKADVEPDASPLTRLFISQYDGPQDVDSVREAWQEVAPVAPVAAVELDAYGEPAA